MHQERIFAIYAISIISFMSQKAREYFLKKNYGHILLVSSNFCEIASNRNRNNANSKTLKH